MVFEFGLRGRSRRAGRDDFRCERTASGQFRGRPDKRRSGWMAIAVTLTLGAIAAVAAPPAVAQSQLSCQADPAEARQKETLRQAIVAGDASVVADYQNLVRKHAREQAECRQGSWPRDRAIWLNLYRCDANFGEIDALFDRIANDGYSQVYLATLANGQVLLPGDDNPTPWPSVARSPATESIDLLANAITAGRARGIEVHAWMFALNFGYAYSQREDRQQALARNGRGQTSLDRAVADTNAADGIFVDPYSPTVRRDYYTLLEAVLDRDPTGVVFDYIRYPRLSSADSVADEVRDLWVYGPASRAALLDRADNPTRRSQLETYLDTGRAPVITVTPPPQPKPEEDDAAVRPAPAPTPTPAPQTISLRDEFWEFSTDFAAQGVVDFLDYVAAPVRAERRDVGAAFFPRGNRAIGRGFDSRLQRWDDFSSSIVWHPMLYGGCNGTDCILDDLDRVLAAAPRGATVIPALAGAWSETSQGRHPPLELQMQAIASRARSGSRGANVNIDAVSHFSFGWQNPELERQRQFCQL